jgi:FSR family fosmidomycin resistance protein-like MFS transporter
MAQALPRQPATAAGLALGLAIAIGGVPLMGGPSVAITTPSVLFAVTLAAGVIMWRIAGKYSLARAGPQLSQD